MGGGGLLYLETQKEAKTHGKHTTFTARGGVRPGAAAAVGLPASAAGQAEGRNGDPKERRPFRKSKRTEGPTVGANPSRAARRGEAAFGSSCPLHLPLLFRRPLPGFTRR